MQESSDFRSRIPGCSLVYPISTMSNIRKHAVYDDYDYYDDDDDDIDDD